jgi:hypothetical protein
LKDENAALLRWQGSECVGNAGWLGKLTDATAALKWSKAEIKSSISERISATSVASELADSLLKL